MIDESLVWTSDANGEEASPPSLRRRIGLYDTTLRDGEQTVGVAFDALDKLEIGLALDRLGIDRIEAGFPMVSAEDSRAYELLLAAGLRAELWGFARALPRDVHQLAELGVTNTVIEAPVSDKKLSAWGLERSTVIERIGAAVDAAQEEGIRTCFFAVDASRADRSFLAQAYRAATGAGAQEVAAVDTLGVCTPETVGEFVATIRDWVGDGIPIHWHGHDDFGLATAGALAAAAAGADWIHGTVNGMGERAGNTDLAQFAMAAEALYGSETGVDFSQLLEVASLVQELAGYELAPWKPLTGRNLFVRESGGVVAQFHEPSAIEPFAAALVGADRGVALGKKSGAVSIRLKADELGVPIPQGQEGELLERIKELGARRRRVLTDDEFRRIVRSLSSNGG